MSLQVVIQYSNINMILKTSTEDKGVHLGENGQNYKISVFCSKSLFRYGGIAFQIFRGLAALEPPKMGGKRGDKGGRVRFFSVFNRKRKRKWKKYFVHFVGNLSRIPKLFFSYQLKGFISAKMVKIIKFLFFAQKVSSGMGALRSKFLGG